ncbi:chlorite dismutase [Glaciihabitans arcticus]|uniref:Coproheme decarboxylase n=1 Tax=Glaciihabitans arcticus TaxID=2668039 RepID=A0A4Q9GZD8_9MICO|nr:hydrogen peroxide-dependent heme synthase [Glaciihabitans arcticus]TBN58203.1 chlorite dismutase [Glaciihabitans arcticus]
MTSSPTGDETPELGYTLWSVLRRTEGHGQAIGRLSLAIDSVEAAGVTIRGFYDVSSIRADADLMIWLHGPDPQKLQWALRELRRNELLRGLVQQWNAMGVHRDAEFTSNHLPAFMRGKEPEQWLTVYPFVRSYEWYLLPDEERRAMLGDHGRKGSEYRQVLANTVASFALGDYEWILALEAPELVDLVDLMRHLRQTDARLHVREEVPFYTGRRITVDEIAEVLS